MSDPNKPSTLLRATPALLDGWCGPVLHPARKRGDALPWVKGPLCWADGRLLSVEGPIMGHDDMLLLDLARPEVQDRVCRVLCGQSGITFRVYTCGEVALGVGDEILVSSEDSAWHDALHLPALATCTTFPEALAVWWAHHHVAQERTMSTEDRLRALLACVGWGGEPTWERVPCGWQLGNGTIMAPWVGQPHKPADPMRALEQAEAFYAAELAELAELVLHG